MSQRAKAITAFAAASTLYAFAAFAQADASPLAAKAVGIIAARCSACHGWASSYEAIMEARRVRPGDPDGSDILMYVESGMMPPGGQALDGEEIGVIYDWVLGGAPKPSVPELRD